MILEGQVICTKPGNINRFSGGNAWHIREFAPSRGKDARCQLEHKRFCRVTFLFEDELLGAVRAIVGKGDYDPTLDIDRYLVECKGFYREGCVCPVFEKLRTVLAVNAAARKDHVNTMQRGSDAYICHGDGRVGIIAPVLEYDIELIPPADELQAICEKCEYCPRQTDDDADDGKMIDSYVIDRGFRKVHGGIIAFFKRLFGKD